jgi:hypothetical protein
MPQAPQIHHEDHISKEYDGPVPDEALPMPFPKETSQVYKRMAWLRSGWHRVAHLLVYYTLAVCVMLCQHMQFCVRSHSCNAAHVLRGYQTAGGE